MNEFIDSVKLLISMIRFWWRRYVTNEFIDSVKQLISMIRFLRAIRHNQRPTVILHHLLGFFSFLGSQLIVLDVEYTSLYTP